VDNIFRLSTFKKNEKMKLIKILIFFIVVSSFAQQDIDKISKIKNVKIHNFGDSNNIDTLNLFFNNEKSIFKSLILNHEGNTIIKEDGLNVNVTLKPKTDIEYVVYTDLKKSEIISREFIYDGGKLIPYLVRENIKPINWELLNNQKTIGGLKCKNAIGKFRGRTYTVWYTLEIPVRLGPWKLNGLPGLIVEAKDDSNEILFYMLSYNNFSKISSISKPIETSTIELKDYIVLRDKQSDNIVKNIISKLPRGATFDIKSIESKPIEIEFEFEKKN